MTFSLSSLSSDLKVPIVFVTWCYHTPSSMKEQADSEIAMESLVRCGRGLNINYVLICMVYFTYFNNRLLTYPKIYMFNFVIANGLRSRPLRIVFLSTVKLYHRHINLNISFAVNANSTFQLVKRSSNQGTRKLKCIQFTHPNTGAKYALKVVNQSRVVFEVC